MVKCLECGKDLLRISNTHLLKCSGLTMEEYRLKHGLDIGQLMDATCVSKRALTTANRSQEQKNQILQKRRTTLSEERNIKSFEELTDAEQQVILGSLLGDGYCYHGDPKALSTYLVLEHGVKQISYLLWKGKLLLRLGAKFYQYWRYYTPAQRFKTQTQIRTKSYPFLQVLKNKFYGPTGKKIDKKLLYMLKPLGLAIWFMDDGAKYGTNYLHLCTQSFTKDDCNLIIQFFKDKYGITPHLVDAQGKYVLAFRADQGKKLIKLIKKHIHPSMLYKVSEIEKLPQATVSKKIHFDSAHYLADYEGKCSRLHGGRYELVVRIKGPIDPLTGMVLDYGYLNSILKTYVVDLFDHKALNYTVPELAWRSTTEIICMYVWKLLIEVLPNLYEIDLYETPDSYCTYQGPSYEDFKYKKDLPEVKMLNYFKDFKPPKDRIIRELMTIEELEA